MNQNNNDITGLGTVKVDNHNNLTDVNINKGENTNINLGFAPNKTQEEKFKTHLEEETNSTRNLAMENVIAGIPTTNEPSLTVAKQKPDLDKNDISKGFTTRDEIMSRLNLMDENGNYTDTYTNYINQGGQPLPGYEYAHQELLQQEHYDEIFKQVEEGSISYDDALMEAYGRDILATMGYDVTSVAYWQNKFLNNDFSNPFTNRYIMDQVKSAAENYHQARLSSQYAHSNVKDTQLNNLVGKELDDSLSVSKIQDLFPEMEKFKENIEDKDFFNALHNGQIAASARMTQDDKGTYYYLHTDGKLYCLDGQSGEGHGTLKMNGDKFEGIDLNNNGLVSFGRSTFTGFTKVFTGIADLGATAVQSIGALLTLGYGDGFDSDDFFGWANSYDGWLNENASWLVDNGYVDLDSSISGQDVFNFAGTMIGTIAGTMTLAGMVGAVGDAGTATSAATKGTGLIGMGQKLESSGHLVAGKLVKGTGTVLKWQTGNIGTNTGAMGGLFRSAQWANGANLQVWGRRIGAAAVANTKNMLNDTRKNILASQLYEDGASDFEIFTRSLATNSINLMIDSVISGGMDDNQFQAWFGRDTVLSNASQKELTNQMRQLLTQGTSETLKQELETQVKGSLKKYLLNRAGVIAINSAADLAGNMLTGAVSGMSGLDEKGKLKDFSWKSFGEGFTMENFARSAVNTLWYSTRSQIKDWNAGLETIGRSHTELLSKFDQEIAKHTGDAEKQAAIAEVKNKYIKDLDEATKQENAPLTYEGRILYAMDKLCEGLKKDGEDVPKILKDVLDESRITAQRDRLKQIYACGEAIYASKLARIEKYSNPGEFNVSILGSILHPIKTAKAGAEWLTGVKGDKETFEKQETKNLMFDQTMKQLKDVIVGEDYFKSLDKVKEINNNRVSTKDLVSQSGYTMLKENNDLAKKLINSGEDIKNNQYLYLPNSNTRTRDYKANEVALDISADLGYLTKVEVEGETVYRVQPYFDQIDFVNNSTINTLIHQSVLALTTNVKASTKQEVINNLSKGLMDENVSDMQKSVVIASILNRLSTKTDVNDKPFMTPKQRDTIFMGLADKGYITKVNTGDIKGDEAFNYLVACGDTMLKIQKKKFSQIDITDPNVQKMLKEYKDNNEITEETYNKIMTLQKENPQAFLNGNISNKVKYIENEMEGRFNNMFPEEQRLSRLVGITNEDDIAKYFYVLNGSKGTLEDFKKDPIYEDIKAFAKEYDKCYENCKTINMDGDIVYVDLTTFRGKTTQDFTKHILSLGNASLKYIGEVKDFQKYESGLFSDMMALNKASDKQGSLIKFNLKESPQTFISFMKDFGYSVSGNTPQEIKSSLDNIKGLRNFSGNNIVLNVPRVNNIEDLKKELDVHGTISLKSVNNKTKVDINGNKLNKVDIDRAIMDQVELKNISPDITVSLKEAPLLNINPFEVPVDGKYDYTLPIASAYLGSAENLRKLSGKLAGMTGRDFTYLLTKSAGSEVKYDSNLENYFICEYLVDKIFDSTYTNIPLSKNEVEWLEEHDYADGHKATSKHNADNIWKISGRTLKNGNDSYYLELKPGITKDEVMDYVVSNKFNIHRLIPLQIKELQTQGKQGIIDAFATHTTEGLEQQLPGHNRETGFSILNVRLPWDDGNNSRLAKFITEVINNKDESYNPIEGAGYTKHNANKESAPKTFDEWYEKAQTSKDPYDIITLRYLDEINKAIHNKDSKEYENHRILVKDRGTRNIIEDFINKGDESDIKGLVKDLKDYYANIQRKEYGVISKASTPNVVTGKAANPDTTTVSTERLAASLGYYPNIDIKTDTDWITIKTVQDAIDMIQSIATQEDNQYRVAFYDDHIITKYIEDDATRLLKNVVGSDGYIPIQDIDEIADILAENYRQAMDSRDTNFVLKESLIPTLEKLYGSEYNKIVDTIFAEAKKHSNLAAKQFETYQAHVKNYGGPSIEDDRYNAIGNMLTKHDGEYRQLRGFNSDGTNGTNKMYEYIKNSILDLDDDKEKQFNKLMTTSSGLLDNEFYDELENSVRNSRNLFTSAPYATDIEKYTDEHNALGHMTTAINTFNELKEFFKGTDDNELMRTAVELVNLHQGVEYAGETANYFVVKNGSLTDGNVDLLDKYASANWNDLLFNIHKMKDELKGCTIIKANSQGVNNLAALKLSYMNLDENFDNFVTELYDHFLLDNSYYLTHGTEYKDIKQLEQDIFGGTINSERIQEVLNKIPSENMSTIQRNRRIYDVFRTRSEAIGMTKQDFFNALYDTDVIAGRELVNNAIEKHLNITDEYKSNKGLRGLINLSYGLGNIDNMTSERRQLINDIKETMQKAIEGTDENAKLSPQQQALNIIVKNLIDREDAPGIDFITRNRSLVDMKQEVESDNLKNGFTINYDNGKPTRIDTKDLIDLVKSFENPEVKSKFYRIVSFDDETSLTHNANDYDQGVFNVGVSIKTRTDNGWVTNHYNIFVNYETEGMTDTEKTKLREAWIKENVDTNNSFYKDNKGYRDTVEIYKNIYDHIDENTLYLKPEEIKEFFNKYSGEGTILLGYNSSDADIPWMKFGHMLDDDILSRYTHVDAKTLGDNSQAIETKNSGKKDVRGEAYDLINEGAHSGLYDADVTQDIFAKIVNTTFNLKSIRDFVYKDLIDDLSKQNIKLSEEQLNTVLKQVDDIVKDAQSKQEHLDEYFNYDKDITTDTVTAATDIFEYMINKRYAATAYAIRDQQIIDNYLSSKALQALSDNSQLVINKLWTYAKANEITKERFINAIRIEMKHTGTDMNSLLETLRNEARVERIMDNLGIDPTKFNEEISQIKLFDVDPSKDPDLDPEQFIKYNTLKNNKEFVDTFHNIIKGLRFSNTAEEQDFLNDMATIMSFREGIDPRDYLNNDVKLINTKISDMYMEYLRNNYGDVDAVIAQSKKGLYDLVDALPIGIEVDNGTGKKVITDSSMIVLSKNQFKNLMGREYDPTKDAELYSQLLIHPADANDKILPRKIVVNTELNGNYMLVPETVIETLGSRDFDGDHLILLKPEDYTQEVLKIYADNKYKIHDTQEAVLSYLRSAGIYYDGYKNTSLVLNTIGRDEKIINLCKEADSLLEQGKTIPDNLTSKFIEEVKSIVPDADDKLIDNVLKDLWVVEKDLYEDTGSTVPIRYINNPAIYASDENREVTLNGKTYSVPVTFSGQERLRAEDSQLVNKYLYNFIDQTTGVTEKYAINKLKNTTINNPWTDLLASGIYGSNTVYKYFENIDGTDKEVVKGLGTTIVDTISKSYKGTKYYSDIEKVLKQSVGEIEKDLSNGFNTAAFNKYDEMLRSIENIQLKSQDSTDIVNALMSEKMKQQYEAMANHINITKKNINLYNELAKASTFFRDDSSFYGKATDYNLNSLINGLAEFNEGSYNKNIFQDTVPVKAFIITHFGKSEAPIGIGEDTVLINNIGKNQEDQLAGYTLKKYKLGSKDKLKEFEEGKWYEKGTAITKGKNPITLNRLSRIVGAKDGYVYVQQVDFLDNGFKITTDIGGKGVVNGTFSTDADVSILLNKPDPRKLSLGSNKAFKTTDEHGKEFEITLKDSNGKKIKAYGFYAEAKPQVTEDTHAWEKDRERNVDALHVVMNANTINSFLMFGGQIKDGKLETNPEAYADLRNQVWKSYNDYQNENFLGVYNRAKISYIINRLTDKELQDAFHTTMDASKLRTRLTNNMYLATDKYTSIAYTLGKQFADKIDDEIGQRLFSEESLSLLGDYTRSRATGTNPFGAFSKSDITAQTNMNADGTSNLSVYKGRTVHLSPDEMNLGKGMTNHEDYYLSPYDFFRLMNGGKSTLNSFKVREMYKQGLLPSSTFVEKTANMENGFRNWSSKYTTKDKELQKFVGQSDSRKTGLTTGKADRIGYRPVEVSLTEPENCEINNTRLRGLSPQLQKLMISGETDLKGNYAKIAMMLYQLQNINPTDSIEQKKIDLSNSKKLYKIFDTHLATQWNEGGTPDVVISKNVPITGNLKELQRATKNSVWNYSTYNAIKNSRVDNKTLDAKALDENVNKDIYKQQTRKFDKELNDIWANLENDFINDRTGVVKDEYHAEEYNTGSKIIPARILSGGEESILEKSVWGRQGLKEDTELGAKLTVALKNQSAGALYIEQEPMRILNNFKQVAMSRMSDKEIKDFAICQALYNGQNESDFNEALKYHNKTLDEVKTTLNHYKTIYPEVDAAFRQHLESIKQLSAVVSKETGEPLSNCLIGMIAPYKATSKTYNNAKCANAIKNALGLQKYNPASELNKQASTLEFDLWNSSESIIAELSKMHSAKVIKDTLINEDMLRNDTLLNRVGSILDTVISESDEKTTYLKNNPEAKQIQDQVFDVVNDLTGFNITTGVDKVTFKQYKDIFGKLDDRLSGLISQFHKDNGRDDLKSYTDYQRAADDTNEDMRVRNGAKAIANFYYAKMIIGQAMIESSPDFANKMGSYIQSLKDEGYSLVNAYGQRYVKGGVVQPWSSSSMANLVENMEIAYNSYNDTMWNQFILEKIISGDIYLMKDDIADHLESHVYTNKIPSNTMKTLKEISKWSSALQMALPSKILNRLISFTGFDYSMGIMYDPNTIKYMGPARRELLAAFQSKGTQMSDELREYMMREGQPIGLTGKDPITFTEDISGPDKVMRVLNTLTDPLEFQNHLGRYAIYLAAKESFDNGKPNYGPMYYAKDAIDSLDNNADKAMMIMDYMLGSPGGFPELSKKTSGLMLYATFPMNFARTMGAYGMSLGKLFKEGFTANNADQWIKTAAVPSMGLAGITGLSMLITSWICDLFGIEEDEKEKMVKELSTLDLVGTVISGSPQKSGSSMNPVENINSMFIEPFTNPYNKTLLEKVFGAVNTNITSHLNPAIKVPVEVATGYDIYGSSLMNTKYQYDNIENGLRKVLGFFIGSNTANSMIEQYKFDKYNDDSNFIESLTKGARRGIASSLGNQKTYKKDMTNYYNRLTDIKNYKYKISDGTYSEDIEDYIEADSMERIRNTKSRYGSYDKEAYQEMNVMLKKMLKNKVEPATVYAYIISEYNNGVSETTIKSVLNNHSIIRKLNSLPDKQAYFDTLSSKEYKDLLKAIEYENEFYPLLQELFPNKKSSSTYVPKRTKYYNKTGSGSSSYYPKSYTPKKPTFVNYYPNNGYNNKKVTYNKSKASINKNNVEVSPQMGVWKNDYNEVQSLNTYNKNKNQGPVKLLDQEESYINNPYYNNLKDYEKRKKVS